MGGREVLTVVKDKLDNQTNIFKFEDNLIPRNYLATTNVEQRLKIA